MFALKPSRQWQPPDEWLPALREIVKTMAHEEITTPLALCVRITGDVIAGMGLEYLLKWLPHGIRKDGAIWKSDREWFAQTGLSYSQMCRVRELWAPLVNSWVEKAQGAPTYHYRLKIEALVEAIAGVYARSVVMIESLMGGFSGESKIHSEVSRKSITNDSSKDSLNDKESKNQNQNIVPETTLKLMQAGVNVNAAQALSEIPMEVVEQVIGSAAGARSPGAYISTALRNWLKQQRQEVIDEKKRQASFERYAPKSSEDVPVPAAAVEPEAAVSPRFEMAIAQLEAQLDQASFTPLRGARLIEESTERWVIQARHEHALAACEGRLRRTIERVVRDVAGSKVEVVFTCA